MTQEGSERARAVAAVAACSRSSKYRSISAIASARIHSPEPSCEISCSRRRRPSRMRRISSRLLRTLSFPSPLRMRKRCRAAAEGVAGERGGMASPDRRPGISMTLAAETGLDTEAARPSAARRTVASSAAKASEADGASGVDVGSCAARSDNAAGESRTVASGSRRGSSAETLRAEDLGSSRWASGAGAGP